MKPLPPSLDQESTPDTDQIQEPSRRNVLKSAFAAIPVAIGLVPAIAALGGTRAAHAEPGHPHCANQYLVGQSVSCESCRWIIRADAHCYDCGGFCGIVIIIDGTCP